MTHSTLIITSLSLTDILIYIYTAGLDILKVMGPSRETHDVRRGRKSRSFSPSLEQLFWPILTTTSFLFHVLGLYLDPGEFKLPEHYVYDLIPSDFHGYNIVSCGSVMGPIVSERYMEENRSYDHT